MDLLKTNVLIMHTYTPDSSWEAEAGGSLPVLFYCLWNRVSLHSPDVLKLTMQKRLALSIYLCFQVLGLKMCTTTPSSTADYFRIDFNKLFGSPVPFMPHLQIPHKQNKAYRFFVCLLFVLSQCKSWSCLNSFAVFFLVHKCSLKIYMSNNAHCILCYWAIHLTSKLK